MYTNGIIVNPPPLNHPPTDGKEEFRTKAQKQS